VVELCLCNLGRLPHSNDWRDEELEETEHDTEEDPPPKEMWILLSFT
jgi:hypothetical protein